MFLGECVVSYDGSHSMGYNNHEKADTRIVVNLVHALAEWLNVFKVCMVDIYVVVLQISKYTCAIP